MKISLDWIKDFVELPDNMDLPRLAYDLTMSTVEVESVKWLADSFKGLLTGVILDIARHPNANKLCICKTDVGGVTREIVCGGSNLYKGMKVVVAAPGAMVRWHGEGEPVEIQETSLRGVSSWGMICIASEIGLQELFPVTDPTAVLDLTAWDVAAGTSLVDALGLNDVILEIDNKSMTNRPDLWGHYGIAREIAALYDLPMKEPTPYVLDSVRRTLLVEVEDTRRCPRYIGVELRGLRVKDADFKTRSRLWRVGIRPINALVDVTNYVMLAVGQPTHAFDADNIHGHIVVRHAHPGENLLLLNDKNLTLMEDDLIIADTESPVGLAGIMGGAKDSVLPTTNRIILEIANFHASGIRRTALRYDNRTEASSRYEKAVDAERCGIALSMAMWMFQELYPEMSVVAWTDEYPVKQKCEKLDVSLSWLECRLGLRIPNGQIQNKLERMGFQVSFHDDQMHIVVPPWRSTGDISIKDDIMEEIARMYGYENFSTSPITIRFTGAVNQPEVDIDRRIREYLAFRCGMREIFTYPWMDERYVDAILQSRDGLLALSTPPSPTARLLRSSLLPNLCKAVEKNQHEFEEFAIFEGAQTLQDRDYTTPYFPNESLPRQRRNISGAFVAPAKDANALFRRAKGTLEQMPRYTHMNFFRFSRENKPIWADNAVWMNLSVEDIPVGNMGLLSNRVAMDCGIKDKAVLLFEIDVDALKPLASRNNPFHHLPEYPVNQYDISMLFDCTVFWKDIYVAVMEWNNRPTLIRAMTFVDEYRGKNIPQGKKSVTFRLDIGAEDRTLKAKEINETANAVVVRLAERFLAEIRSS